MARTALLVKKKPDKTATKQGDKGVTIGWTPSGTKKAKVLKSVPKSAKTKLAPKKPKTVTKTKSKEASKPPSSSVDKVRHLVTR